MSADRGRRFLLEPLYFISEVLWGILVLFHSCVLGWHQLLNHRRTRPLRCVGDGKTVLLTTGRQAKTVHVARALKEVGATVVVSDYDYISACAVSLACDKFVMLPALDVAFLDEWVESLSQVIEEYSIDLIVPCSTINEVLFLAVAKERLSSRFPHVEWLCMGLDTTMQLDDRDLFSKTCVKYGVPVPDFGRLVSREQIPCVDKISRGIICKRIESSVNRSEEIVQILPGEKAPECVKPSVNDPWQWQAFVQGQEYSVWYVCLKGRVTFSACYKSGPDLVYFDAVPVPSDIDKALRLLIREKKLSGQYAFDFIRDECSGKCYVLECNPRASSILETVSSTPYWGEAFFGVDVSSRERAANVGFAFHRNCWPWASRKDGYFSMQDPLPFFAAECVWPLRELYKCLLARKTLRKIDVNICKFICDGPSAPRNISAFQNVILEQKMYFLRECLKYVDSVFVDKSLPELDQILVTIKSASCRAILVGPEESNVELGEESFGDDQEVSTLKFEKFCASEASGSYRILLGPVLSSVLSYDQEMTLLCPSADKPLRNVSPIPLRRIRVLHVVGSCASKYYEEVSVLYCDTCINSWQGSARLESVVAYVHRTKEWSISCVGDLKAAKNGERLSLEAALSQIHELDVDVVLPHMFDYDGLTAYRSLFSILDLPIIGNTGDILALSTHKGRTKACAAAEDVPTPAATILRPGNTTDMPTPFIVKPVEEDNSMGLEVVWDESQKDSAIERARGFGSDEILCEQYIPLGREMRVAAIEVPNGGLVVLPFAEYLLSKESPIRKPEDKLCPDDSGVPCRFPPLPLKCPAVVDSELKRKLTDAVTKAHTALGCRDYSIYDFRISPEGDPYMLESCLYCSFSPRSILVIMAKAGGMSPEQTAYDACDRACSRRPRRCAQSTSQVFGMKSKV